MSPAARPVAERFWEKVDKGSDPDECWLWRAALNGNGYGNFAIAPHQFVGAHRFAYQALVGPIPDGLQLDHLCRNPGCVNPAHLEPVTHLENMRRGWKATAPACIRGHAYTPENTLTSPPSRNGRRECRECKRAYFEQRRRRMGSPPREARYKLDAEKVGAIRRSPANNSALAREYGVSVSLIRAVRQRLVWRDAA